MYHTVTHCQLQSDRLVVVLLLHSDWLLSYCCTVRYDKGFAVEEKRLKIELEAIGATLCHIFKKINKIKFNLHYYSGKKNKRESDSTWSAPNYPQ